MADLVDRWPVWLAFLVLFLGALVRGTLTYWAGRGLRAGGGRSRWAGHLDRPLVLRAEGWVRRFGAPVVSLGFLTVGVQTAINVSAGLLRMPQRRFLPAVTVGALLWATVYTTVGLALVDAVLGRISWGWAIAAVAVVAGLALGSRWVGRRGGRAGDASAGDA